MHCAQSVHTMKPRIFALIASLSLTWGAPAHATEPDYHVADQQSLPGNARWDYLTFDGASRRLFITRGDHVDVYDTALRRIVGSINGTAGVHGVALVPAMNKGFTSDGDGKTVTVFDLSSLKVLAKIPVLSSPDAIAYDPFSKRIFTANGDAGSLTVIDATTNAVISTVEIGGSLEFMAVDGKGRLYVNLEEQNGLAVIDTAKLTVLARHDMSAGCNEPTGLAIDAATDRLFAVCRNQKMLAISGSTGEILATVGIGKGCDAVAFDKTSNKVFTSNGEGTLSVVSADSYKVEQTARTKPSARTLALDATGPRIFTVAADPEGVPAPGTRPRMKPGTMVLLTLSQ